MGNRRPPPHYHSAGAPHATRGASPPPWWTRPHSTSGGLLPSRGGDETGENARENEQAKKNRDPQFGKTVGFPGARENRLPRE